MNPEQYQQHNVAVETVKVVGEPRPPSRGLEGPRRCLEKLVAGRLAPDRSEIELKTFAAQSSVLRKTQLNSLRKDRKTRVIVCEQLF